MTEETNNVPVGGKDYFGDRFGQFGKKTPGLNEHEHSGKDGFRKVKFQNLNNLFIVDATPDFASEEFSIAIHRTSGAMWVMVGGTWTAIGGSSDAIVGRMSRGAAQSINNITETKIQLDTIDVEEGVDCDTTNNRIVALTAGYYFATGEVTYDTPVASSMLSGILNKNGTQMAYTATQAVNTALHSIKVSGVIELAVNDYVEIATFHNCGGSEALNVTNGFLNYLELIKI